MFIEKYLVRTVVEGLIYGHMLLQWTDGWMDGWQCWVGGWVGRCMDY